MSPPGGSQKRKASAQPHTPVKQRGHIEYESEKSSSRSAPAPRSVQGLAPYKRPPAVNLNEDLVLMVLDVVEEAGGARYQVWATTPKGATVLCRVSDFQPYFYIAAPKRPGPTPSATSDQELDWSDPGCQHMLRGVLNRFAPADSRVQHVEPVRRRPLLFYRPERPRGDTYLRVWLAPGGNARRCGTAVLRAITGGTLKQEGLIWRDVTVYEHEVNPLQRFCVDVPISGGAWVCLSPCSLTREGVPTPVKGGGSRTGGTAPDAPGQGFTPVPHNQRVSTCDVEVTVPWSSIHCLSPDATQLADDSWSPLCGSSTDACTSDAIASGAAAALRGDIAPLRVLLLDVCSATRDGVDRTPVPAQGDPVVAISCAVFIHGAAENGARKAAEAAPQTGGGASGESSTLLSGNDERDGASGDAAGGHGGEAEGEEDGGGGSAVTVATSAAAVTGGPSSMPRISRPAEAARPVVFVLAGAGAAAEQRVAERVSEAQVLLFHREEELLLTWLDYFHAADPDVVSLFQVASSLEVLQQRFAALRLGAGGLHLSRYLPLHSRPLAVKRVVMYSAAWVRSAGRMQGASNQETFRAEVDGRVVVDVLRQVLTINALGSFSLVDCVQSIKRQTLEVLRPNHLAALAGIHGTPPTGACAASAGITTQQQQLAAALRLARYSLRRVEAVRQLLDALATLPEAVEMARATGLTLGQVHYNAQMIRTWSLLLRVGARQGFIAAGRQDPVPLSASPWLMHPVENGTVGLHRQPVAILDFASLYPSIYRAHNLCYTTLLHQGDAAAVPPEDITTTPTGAMFVKPGVRRGVLPSILAALIAARTATRAQLRTVTGIAQRAVLDARQKALKVTANALYGFTGANASPLQCVQLADSCLAYGSQACQHAKQVLEAAAAAGELAPHGNGAHVIYGHTDSLFVKLPAAKDVAAAIAAGRRAGEVVSGAFPAPLEMKFERVCAPLMLLHVNRYAGRAFEKEEDAGGEGELIVKGLKSMWRQTAPILRTTLHGALVRIIMQNDVPGAVEFVEGQVRRLLSGRVSMHELIMTGGLWRVTGEQVAAAAEGGDATPGKAGGGGAGAEAEEVRGPHAALAVRLSQRDSGRSFVLGERLPYVLLPGHKLQEEAAEDPLEAARAGLQADLELYWRNKMQRPLAEVFETCLSPAQVQGLLHGPHTLVKVDAVASQVQGGGAVGPASPSPSKGRGGKGAPRQTGMMQFYRATAKCLGCRRGMPGFKGAAEDAPGLCESCSGQEGKWAQTYEGLSQEAAEVEAQRCAAHAACRQCHSGLMVQAVACENSECPLTYARLASDARLGSVVASLRRMDIF